MASLKGFGNPLQSRHVVEIARQNEDDSIFHKLYPGRVFCYLVSMQLDEEGGFPMDHADMGIRSVGPFA